MGQPPKKIKKGSMVLSSLIYLDIQRSWSDDLPPIETRPIFSQMWVAFRRRGRGPSGTLEFNHFRYVFPSHPMWWQMRAAQEMVGRRLFVTYSPNCHQFPVQGRCWQFAGKMFTGSDSTMLKTWPATMFLKHKQSFVCKFRDVLNIIEPSYAIDMIFWYSIMLIYATYSSFSTRIVYFRYVRWSRCQVIGWTWW